MGWRGTESEQAEDRGSGPQPSFPPSPLLPRMQEPQPTASNFEFKPQISKGGPLTLRLHLIFQDVIYVLVWKQLWMEERKLHETFGPGAGTLEPGTPQGPIRPSPAPCGWPPAAPPPGSWSSRLQRRAAWAPGMDWEPGVEPEEREPELSPSFPRSVEQVAGRMRL